MKKYLLSLAALAMGCGFAFAGSGDSQADPMTVSEALAYISNGGSADAEKYVKGYITEISEISTQYGNATYDMADAQGGTPTLKVYRGYYFDGAKFTDENQLQVNDQVIVCGKLVDYNGTSEFTTGSKIVEHLRNGQAVEPGENPGGGGEDPEVEGYTIFDITNPGTWTGDANGYTSSMTVGGKHFTITTAKADSSTDLLSPDANSYAWRVYKNSEFTISSTDVNMKGIVIYYDDYNSGQYALTLTLSAGWTGSIDGAVYTLSNANGSNTFTGKAEGGQVRIKKIIVTDGQGGGGTGGGGDLPEGVLYMNSFEESLDGWEKVNDETISDYAGWKINANPKCAVANSYYGGENHAANAKLQKEFNLTGCTDVKVSFEQGFGYFFPTAQVDQFRVYVVSGGQTEYKTMTNFPPAPETGNWTKEWATNEFDLSEYDGETIIIGFEYDNPGGSQSYVWEIKNFVLMGESSQGAVNGIEADENVAPVYYNLQGVRVANPTNGLYIVVKGDKSSKVMF